jgi:hypothetical protein
MEHSAFHSSSVHSLVIVAMISCSPLMRRTFPLGSPQYSASNLPDFHDSPCRHTFKGNDTEWNRFFLNLRFGHDGIVPHFDWPSKLGS